MSIKSVILIGLVVGESSGDLLGAGLISALRSKLSNVRFIGIAGPRMKCEGMESWYNMEELSIVGITEVIVRIPRILHIRKDLIRRFSILKPDVFIGIDSPDFTISLERSLRKRGIRTIHYVSPSIWAWRKKRIFKLALAADNILSFLPFEKMLYDQLNIPCQFVGHALADLLPLDPDKLAARRELGIPFNVRCLVILPGSRRNEIKMLTNDFLHCARLLIKKFPELEILVSLTDDSIINEFQKIYAKDMKLRILNNQSHQAMIAADVALLASGTATLECMLAKCPMVVAYRVKSLTFMLLKILVKTPWISLPNLLAGRELVKEFIQDSCHPENLEQALTFLLENVHHRSVLKKTFRILHQQIRCNANEKAADAVLRLIN
ncbi:lipid-A-disaccharide synthase [Blochmannia endosymbiont of Colobopsis nipponica]|uniref:lipid-A-disaccharide synthase n=1 Tax=Blochmannia endosymbiont of Colobopsis nipponica TaxID=2681987 RepID=UPI00177CA039|nr:lipid-A-disaccharide synthase [Blochmannia endosymbiont of Colobopsis nipponica]QOI11154.1 lipid-A-disaccharide synthase [Blochmannia endosymbiont of Colobopsis nipponica]